MTAWLTAHEPALRLGVFAGVFLLVAAWEVAAARRELAVSKGRRWLANLGLVVVNTVALRLLVPTAAVAVAALAAERGWGALNLVGLPAVVELLLSLALLDLAIYLQHVLFHAVPALWRLHMVHHADLDFDVTTGARFHPLEILLSMGIKIALVLVVGPSAVAVLLFEILLNGTATFNHGNVRLPPALDRVLRWVLVTPDMHRVHHSVVAAEANSNFGFCLPWWDRLGGTYRDQPAAGHEAMRIGVDQLQQGGVQSLSWMLLLPFKGEPGGYAIDRREWS